MYWLFAHSGYFYKTRLRSRPAVFWGAILLMCVLTSECWVNLIVRFFKTSYFLNKCGKYSFGMYLFHFGAFHLVNQFSFFRNNHLRIVSYTLTALFYGFLVFHLLEKHLINIANNLCGKITSFKVLSEINVFSKINFNVNLKTNLINQILYQFRNLKTKLGL